MKLVCAIGVLSALFSWIKQMPLSDKAQHCSLSCYMTFRCGTISSYTLGLAKETLDLVGPGNAEKADLTADYTGSLIAKNISDDIECIQRCQDAYPK